MQHILTTKSIFYTKQTLLLFVGFFALRILSLLLFNNPIIQATLVFALIMIFGIVYFKESHYGWYIILGELFLGGSGHLLEFFGLSIRTILIITFLFLWTFHGIASKNSKFHFKIKHKIFYAFFPLIFFITLAIGIGLWNNNGLIQVVQDAIPFSYFVLLLPFYHYFYKKHTQEYLVRLLFIFLLGSAIFSLFTYIIFSTGITEINNSLYYTWFRDVAMGKITDMGGGFFRIVTPEHLLFVPGALLISSLIMRDEKHNNMWYVFLALILLVLVIDLSRTYLLAIIVGLFVLKYKHKTKKWLQVSGIATTTFLGIFFALNIIFSGFTSTGLDLLGVRIASIGNPMIETSSYTRMSLLDPIGKLIRKNPLSGTGFGASISFISPNTHEYITTTEFDWGLLELLAELGIFGFLSFLAILVLTLYEIIIKIESLSDYQDFYVGLLAGLISLIIMTITSSALFHVFGIFYLTLVFVMAMKPIDIFHRTLEILYRVFNRLEV